LTETQVLAHLLQHKRTTAPALARRFSESTVSAHQPLVRLERKGLVKKTKTGYKAEFELTENAEALSRKTKEQDKNLPFILFLGLASYILLLTCSNKDKNNETR